MDNKEKKCKEALEYAIMIIKAYELECRNLKKYLEQFNPDSFCQGCMFKGAVEQISKKMG